MSLALKNIFSFGDVVDLYHAARLKGISFLIRGFGISYISRSKAKWNRYECSKTDFWVIPEVKKRWNETCTGNPEYEYEDYVVRKYLSGLSGLKMLSVGCGNSSHEQAFSKHDCFVSVEGIDISENQVNKARQCAIEDHCPNINYRVCNFENENLEKESYDLILFHSSIHHFKNIKCILLEKVLPILKSGAMLVLFDYTGPNRLQWTKEQIKRANFVIKKLPKEKRTWYGSRIYKRKVYRPGLFRSWLTDPSEAVDSESILKNLHNYFDVLEEKKLGGNLIHPLLKGISHHFCNGSQETRKHLNFLFDEEDDLIKGNKSDFTFGVYRKKSDGVQ